MKRGLVVRIGLLALISLAGCYGPGGGLDASQARMVADFEPPAVLLLAWKQPFQSLVQRVMEEVDGRVPVLLVDSGDSEPKETFSQSIDAPLDSIWIRDYGPFPVRDGYGDLLFLDAEYWPSRPHDDALPLVLGEKLGVRVVTLPLAVEGGDIVSNGDGLCLSTRRLLDRNPGLTRLEIERTLGDFLGCGSLVLLRSPPGIPGGHVDTFARFSDAETVLLAEVDATGNSEDAQVFEWNAELLQSRIRVVRVPVGPGNGRVAPLYLNYLLAGDLVLVPHPGQSDASTDSALAVMREEMLGYDVRPFDAFELLVENGGLRCASMAVPE